MLADTDHKVCDAYGTWVTSTWGPGVARQTFVIGADGNLLKHYPKVSPSEHAATILADLAAAG